MKKLEKDISEKLLHSYIKLLVEKVRSNKFSLKEFKEMDDAAVMLAYCSECLEFLGEGSSRTVYRYSSSYVLKIASNKKGLGQNEEEMNVFTNPTTKRIVSKVVDYDKDYFWLMSEIVRPVKNRDEFFQLCGVPIKDSQYFDLDDIEDITDYSIWNSLSDVVSAIKDFPKKTQDFIVALFTVVKNNKLLQGDVEDIKHWGKTIDGKLVMLDYGYSEGVWNKHYNDNNSDKTDDFVNSSEYTSIPNEVKKLYKQNETSEGWPDISKAEFFVSASKTSIVCFLKLGEAISTILHFHKTGAQWEYEEVADEKYESLIDLPRKKAKI